MAATAPFCNVTVFTPPPGPVSPSGFRTLPVNATLQDVIAAVNTNFSPQVQNSEFSRQLARDIAQFNSQVRSAADKEIGRLQFMQTAIVRQKIKVENPQDPEQWVMDDRVMALTLTDSRTGASWAWQNGK